ncbi:MAG TPA: hypothetical protein PKY25_01955 [Bacilli bacterium]|nr:hypothetical protein [Bacilli bacterium]
MKKKIIIVISVVVLLGIGFAAYISFFNTNVKNNNNSNTSNTTTTKSNSKENIIHTDIFTYNINNKNKKVKFVYIKESGDSFNEAFASDIQSAKESGDYVYNVIYLKIFIDDVEIKDVKFLIHINTESKSSKFTDFYKKTDIKKFMGEDKEYFVFAITEPHQFVDGRTIPIIFNDQGKLLYKINFTQNFGTWVVDKNSRFYEKDEMYLIGKNAVYFTELICGVPYDANADEEDISNEIVQEHILTVDNDVVNIAPGKIYKGGGAGALPEYCQE